MSQIVIVSIIVYSIVSLAFFLYLAWLVIQCENRDVFIKESVLPLLAKFFLRATLIFVLVTGPELFPETFELVTKIFDLVKASV